MKRLILVSVMIVCVVLCFSISKAENPETVLQIINEENIINLMDARTNRGRFCVCFINH